MVRRFLTTIIIGFIRLYTYQPKNRPDGIVRVFVILYSQIMLLHLNINVTTSKSDIENVMIDVF